MAKVKFITVVAHAECECGGTFYDIATLSSNITSDTKGMVCGDCAVPYSLTLRQPKTARLFA